MSHDHLKCQEMAKVLTLPRLAIKVTGSNEGLFPSDAFDVYVHVLYAGSYARLLEGWVDGKAEKLAVTQN
jgi:hypothetical protein